MGFVLVPASPRAISLDLAARLIDGIDQTTFLLTHNLEPDALVAAALVTGASGVQPYGRHAEEAAAAAIEVGLMVLRPVAGDDEWKRVPDGQFPLFDSRSPDGTANGRRFETGLLPKTERSFVVAGGLNAGNVGGLIEARHPFGVDVSSGIEVRPGQKDHDLLDAFVQAVREAS